MQLAHLGRFVDLGQAFLGRLQMRIAGAAEPDVALGVLGLGLELGDGLARTLLGHRDLDAAGLLELVGEQRAPFDLDRAVDVQDALRRGRRRQSRRAQGDKECDARRYRLHASPNYYAFVTGWHAALPGVYGACASVGLVTNQVTAAARSNRSAASRNGAPGSQPISQAKVVVKIAGPIRPVMLWAELLAPWSW